LISPIHAAINDHVMIEISSSRFAPNRSVSTPEMTCAGA
jgi:hypothetical protein